MELVEFAEREIRLAGIFDADSDYGGMLRPAILKVIEAFSEQGHSGYSAEISIAIISKLLRFENLTPITDAEDNWVNVSELNGPEFPPVWQCTRNPYLFSNDSGKTYYHIDDDKRTLVESEKSKQHERAAEGKERLEPEWTMVVYTFGHMVLPETLKRD
jgi:hypothetical protein